MFHQLAILDAEDVNCRHIDLLAGGRGCPQRSLVGALDIDQGHHFVPVSQQVHYSSFQVREGCKVHTEKLVWPWGKACRHGMVDSSGRNELVKGRQVLLVNDLVIETLNKSLVI